jgi:hypothetical protein
MPKKLERCVKKVRASGKSKSASYGICVKSTGLSPHKRKKK